jgi:hypothetical protein
MAGGSTDNNNTDNATRDATSNSARKMRLPENAVIPAKAGIRSTMDAKTTGLTLSRE